jgi:hypothetical protein
MKAEGTQLVAEFVAFPLAILFFAARCFTRIYESALGGYAGEERGAEIDNGGGGGDKEQVNNINPHSPLIYLLGKGTWAETWRQERKRQPTNGRGKYKITALPTKRFALSLSDVSRNVVIDIMKKIQRPKIYLTDAYTRQILNMAICG